MATRPDDETTDDLVRTLARHERVRVVDVTVNPTKQQDAINISLPETAQYPTDGGNVPTSYGPELLYNDTPYTVPHTGYILVRCSRARYRNLTAAWGFFDRQRILQAWASECPVYRTARYWVKRVWK